MKQKALFLVFFSIALLTIISCSEGDDVEKVVHFNFSQNDIVLDNKAHSLEVSVTNYKDAREWEIGGIRITDGKTDSYVYDNWQFMEEDSDGCQIGCPSEVADYCYRLAKKNNGEKLEISIDKNDTGSDRNIQIFISNGYDEGVLSITQKK